MSSSRSASLAQDIIKKLATIADPDLAATADPVETSIFTNRACAERLRTFAASQWLPPAHDDPPFSHPLPPEELARRGWRCAADGDAVELTCTECGATTPASEVVDAFASDEAHCANCPWRGLPRPRSVWDDGAASARERADALLEGLTVFRDDRSAEAASKAEKLGAAGWDVCGDTKVSCSYCGRSSDIGDISADMVEPTHRVWCPRVRCAAGAPPAKRKRLSY
mmetsp:Transcript_8250/g.24735  ORF Transcript_8250/g.24735 Transcript_8250/m.24735 type:complete len:225 (-) Transcript_8250:47-721(-)